MGLDAGTVSSDVAVLPALTPRSAGWVLSLVPRAGEGGGCFVSSLPPKRSAYVARGNAHDPQRAAEEAGRRARKSLRQYCAANRLNRLGTLTYAGAGCHDPRQIRADVGEFFRALREGLGGDPLAYVWVPEWHKTGHGLHAHFAVGRFVPRSLIKAAWGRGFVHIKLLGDLPVGSGSLAEARMAARYLSKYVTKTFTDDTARVQGLHRYDVGQGFQPQVVRLRGRSSDDVIGQASEIFGMAPAYRWSSADVEGWSGPPAIWAAWAG
ncbi:hypothetical protein [Pengzhenrongella phosphoraccumulans]|uniref:rolling circle replication-associated protein n=1 Tax=Pengzhenrongella phosphoraccumulans TaxID=3114394 RepID=UPI0038902BCD